MKTAFIYGLRCPLTGLIRYVGKCETPKERFSAHLRSKDICYRGNWIRSLKAQGLKPAFEILTEVPNDSWEFWERSYIRAYRCLGFDLVNGTDGGDGCRNPSTETRAKIGAANRGRKHTPEQRAKWSVDRVGAGNPNFGKTTPPEARAKMRAARLGKKLSPETRAKISRPGEKSPSFGKKKSPECRAKLRAAHLGKKHSPEHCAAKSRGQLGKKSKSNTSGFSGVFRKAGKWQVRICEKHFGYFSKIEDAVFVRNLAFDKFYGNK